MSVHPFHLLPLPPGTDTARAARWYVEGVMPESAGPLEEKCGTKACAQCCATTSSTATAGRRIVFLSCLTPVMWRMEANELIKGGALQPRLCFPVEVLGR